MLWVNERNFMKSFCLNVAIQKKNRANFFIEYGSFVLKYPNNCSKKSLETIGCWRRYMANIVSIFRFFNSV